MEQRPSRPVGGKALTRITIPMFCIVFIVCCGHSETANPAGQNEQSAPTGSPHAVGNPLSTVTGIYLTVWVAEIAGHLQPAMKERIAEVLASSGIKSANENEWRSTPNVARLRVWMPVVCGEEGWCGYSVTVSVDQHVDMPGGARALATTWHNSYTRAIRRTHLSNVTWLVEVDSATLTRQFIDAYRGKPTFGLVH